MVFKYIILSAACVLSACSSVTAVDTSQDTISSEVLSRSDLVEQVNDWGIFVKYFEGSSYGTKDVLSGVAEIKPGQEIHPPHEHAEEEYLMITSGEGIWTLNGKTFPAVKGDMLYADPWDSHGLKNTGSETLSFVFWKWSSKNTPVSIKTQ